MEFTGVRTAAIQILKMVLNLTSFERGLRCVLFPGFD